MILSIARTLDGMEGTWIQPKWFAADTAYGTGKFLNWLIGSGITPHIPGTCGMTAPSHGLAAQRRRSRCGKVWVTDKGK
jgi:hypothetical protein